jgi:hypothetical protein
LARVPQLRVEVDVDEEEVEDTLGVTVTVEATSVVEIGTLRADDADSNPMDVVVDCDEEEEAVAAAAAVADVVEGLWFKC